VRSRKTLAGGLARSAARRCGFKSGDIGGDVGEFRHWYRIAALDRAATLSAKSRGARGALRVLVKLAGVAPALARASLRPFMLTRVEASERSWSYTGFGLPPCQWVSRLTAKR